MAQATQVSRATSPHREGPRGFRRSCGHAVAQGSAKVSQEGSQLSSLANLPSVVVSDTVDLARELREPATISTGS